MHPVLSLRQYRHEQIAHSHAHAQLVFGLSGCLDFEVAGQGCQVLSHSLAVVPPSAHHACASPAGSHCLVLDVPAGGWLQQRLGVHADAGRRLLERPGRVLLNPAQSQLVNWLAASVLLSHAWEQGQLSFGSFDYRNAGLTDRIADTHLADVPVSRSHGLFTTLRQLSKSRRCTVSAQYSGSAFARRAQSSGRCG